MGAGAISVGDILGGKYKIESELGAGAMGLVFCARHQALNKLVAVKTLRAEIANDAELLGRFEQEARAASAIGHPNIVQVFDLGSTQAGARYMVMEHLDGQSLAELLAVSPLLKPERAVRIMSQVLSALAAAHRCGIVHRDLKPDNIFITHNDENPELVKLLDFGISKVLEIADPNIAGADSAARRTQFGSVLGTPLYMSPEQARGLTNIDHRADLWAVGCVLYEMMCGQPPFDGENYNQILMNILGTKPIRPSQLRPTTPAALEHVIMRAMTHDRDKRYGSALTLREELQASLTDEAQAKEFAPIPTPPPIKPQTINTAPAAAGGLGSGALAAAGGSLDDAAFASALDNLTEGALSMGVSGEPLPPQPTPAVVAPPPVQAAPEPAVAPAPAPPSAPAGDRFAPPGTEEEAMSLDVDMGGAVPMVARTRPTLDTPVARPEREARRQPSSSGGGFGKLIIGLVLLGIIGGAGYMIYKQREAVTGPGDKSTRVKLDVPQDAEIEIYVDNSLLRDTSFDARLGQRYVVEMRAKGRLSQRMAVIGKKDLPPISVARLHQHYIAVERGTRPTSLDPTGSHVGDGAPTFADVDVAFEKLRLYHTCVGPVGVAIRKSAESYARVTKRDILRMRVTGVVAMSDEVVDPCRAKITRARDKGGFRAIQDLATPYLESVEELNRTTQHLVNYYNGKLYQKDRGKEGAKSHARLKKLYASAIKNHNAFATSVRAHLIEWRGHELAAIGRAGKHAHFHLRGVLMASLRWTWAEIAGASKPALKQRAVAVITARAELETYKKNNAGQLAKIDGAKTLLKQLDAVVALARKAAEKQDTDANKLRDLHNGCVVSFNRITL